MYQGRRGHSAAVFVVLLALVTAGCTNAPPPPVVTSTPAPPSPPTLPTEPPKPNVVVAGVGELEPGFNPHAVADQSAATAALADLMLPSVFVPGPDGKPQLNGTLMESAEVLDKAEKFTVRYRIRTDAGWSDGAPIAAEDFVYLAEQMRTQPGVVNPVGYRLITDVASRQGGKTVLVTFSQPYPGWKSLFDHLLPAHLVKDAPGGWANALDDGYPASGGPFAIRQFDLERGQIVLMRNERYWGPAAVSERIVLRANDPTGQIAALRNGSAQLAVFDPDSATMRALRDLGEDVRLTTVARPVTAQLLLRPASSQLAKKPARKAILEALDRKKLIRVGTGGGPSQQMQAQSHVLAPSVPGYTATGPPTARAGKPNPKQVTSLLRKAGYQRSGGVWVRDGRPLNLVIAAPFRKEHYIEIAEAAAEQLRKHDIKATVVTPKGDELFRQPPTTHPLAGQPAQDASVDIAVTPRPAGGHPASMMAANWGCPTVNPRTAQPYPYNMAGFCDRMLQPTIEAAVSDRMPFVKASSVVEKVLWSKAVAVPLYQESVVLAMRHELKKVEMGDGFASPFASARKWLGNPGETYDW